MRWLGAAPSFGCCWWKSEIGAAFAQAASSSLPSIVTAPETDAAVARGRDADAAGVVCALNAPVIPKRNAAAAVMDGCLRIIFGSLSTYDETIARTLRVGTGFQLVDKRSQSLCVDDCMLRWQAIHPTGRLSLH